MPRFFFDVLDRLGVIKDDEGMELPSLDEAKAEAMRSAQDLIAEAEKIGPPALYRSIEVQTAEGATVWKLKFHDAVARH
jgi:hypothetical protein